MRLTVSLAQMAVARSDPENNLSHAEIWVAAAAQRDSEIICFPEMWTTGFDWAYNARVAADQERVIERVADMARRHGIWINGSMLALNEQGQVSNTSILFDSRGARAGTYRKTHLFSLMHEERHVAAGQSLCAAETPWGLVGLTVCYDVRFPELYRTYALKGVRIILSPTAFPYPRLPHWKVLARARAIENQFYFIAANQVGSEDFGPDGATTYFGDSVIIDPWGETVVEASETKEELLTATLDLEKVDEVRSKMRVLQDRRPDLYELG